MTVQHLAEAELGVALGKRHVSAQRARIERLERNGFDSTQAKQLLAIFESSQRLFVERRDRLRSEKSGFQRPCLTQLPGLQSRSEMARRIRAHDWQSTPLGPITAWPSTLATLVELMLAHPFPSAVICGSERVLLYNDAAARLFVAWPPAVLGCTAAAAFQPEYLLADGVFERAFAGEALTLENLRFGANPNARGLSACLTPVRNVDGAVAWVQLVALSTNKDDLRASRDERSFLLLEPHHRIRDTLRIMRSIVRRTAETSEGVEDYATHLEGRLDALARVAAIGPTPLAGVALDALIAEEILAIGGRTDDRVVISGRPLRLCPGAATIIAIAVHELATNAMKFGALSPTGGKLNVSWQIEAGPSRTLIWLEGSGVRGLKRSPTRRGFGVDFLERTLAYELDATTLWTIDLDGLLCTIEIPLADRVAA